MLGSLIVNNTVAGPAKTVTINGNLSVTGTLSTYAGETLDMGTYALSGTLSTITNSGIIKTQNTSSTPLTTGKTWDGTVQYNGASAQTALAGTYNNLTISTTGGASASGNITVNGILNLSGANASATKGCLEMVTSYGTYPGTSPDNLVSYTLTMGSGSSTTGTGDVTGKVKRTTIVANTAYTFGNQFTTIALSPGTMPSDMTVTIKIGSAPPLKPESVKRSYEIVPTGGSGCTLAANFHYLDSELQSNTEAKLVTWDYDLDGGSNGVADEHGRASYDYSNNYVGMSNIPIDYFISVPVTHAWRTIFMLSENVIAHHVWNGSVSSNWYTDLNWNNGLPGSDDFVDIPGSSSYSHELTLTTESVTVNNFTIAATGKINMGSATITVANLLSGGWEDDSGLSDPGTSTVIFANPGATVSGTPNFYNVQINNGASLTLQGNSTMKIKGAVTRTGTGVWYADELDGTVEYNGASQTVVLPDALPHYHNLILSGSGTKTLPVSALTLHGGLTLAGTVTTAPTATLNIGGDLTLGSGTTFTAGSLTHNLGGNFVNNGGTFSIAGSTFNFDGATAQTIGGTTEPAAFNNVNISNAVGVTVLKNTTTSSLNIGSGKLLTVAAGKSLTASGTTTLGSSECLVLKSSASGTASFIDNGTISGGGTARIERYLTPYGIVADLKFHFISSPVAANTQNIEPEFIVVADPAITDFYKWDEPNNTWINFRSDTYTVRNESFGDNFKFVPGQGYMVAYPVAVTKNFSGVPFTGSLTMNCSHQGDGWNLLGNPYPSSVDWSSLSKGNGMDAALYYYDNATPGYKYYSDLTGGLGSASQYIAPMQGFMVHAKNTGTQTVSFSNVARTHSGQDVFWKSGPITTNILDLKVQGNNSIDYARVCFYEQATENFDGDYDAYKLFSYSSVASELYSVTKDNTSLAINTQPLTAMDGGQVPVAFKVGLAGNYTLSAEKLNSFDASTYITLEDKATNTLQKLNDNPVYAFTASVQDNADRFVLHFKNASSVPNAVSSENVKIYVADGNIVVTTQEATNSEIRVNNILGQQVLRNETNGNSRTVLNAQSLPNGVYIVSMIVNNKTISQKVVVNN